MKKYKLYLVWVIIVSLLLGFGIYIRLHHLKVFHSQVVQDDPVADVLLSISHKGKLVVTDVNVRTEMKSHVDSSFFDASVNSNATARLQVYLDLSLVAKDWVTQSGNDLTIAIPRSAIKSEVIPTGEEHHSNDSIFFEFEPGEEKNLEVVNHKRMIEQLVNETKPAIEESVPMVELQTLRLFSAALANTPYHVKVSVDNTK